ncbi:hypothetical protein EMPS_00960 [Entomortierella parvispora]|uniref:Septin-type G domain-containing protein n=1 Tax=Entomortierella parvispora TaxID=205924 RepID=A0A9P3H239_9FUNG|nr:hypothetical protein EMPS_00960 [Entomortierella parvispora]
MSYSMRRKNLVSELNLMVAGYSGLGKTSFIRTLFGTLKLRSGPGSLKNKASAAQMASGTSTPTTEPTSPSATTSGGLGTKANGTKDSVGYATGELERTLNSFEALFEIEESAEKINLTLVDTPGFLGSDEVVDAHCDEIIAYLEYQFDLTLAEERKVRRNPKATDNQIHACLYFIDHSSTRPGLSAADIRILQRLGTRVNLIPVLSRADTLTRAQTKKLKQAILKDAALHQIQFFQFLSPKLAKKLLQQQGGTEDHEQKKKRNSRPGPGDDEEAEENGEGEEEEEEDDEDEDEDEWDPETLEEKAHLQSLAPFTVIAKEEDVEIKDKQGKPVQGREFPWGVLNCFDSDHCDLSSLRSALLSSHRQELKEITFGYFYEKYRTEKLLARTKSQHLQFQQQQLQSAGSTASLNNNNKTALLKNGGTLTPKESMLSVGSGSIVGPWEE